MKVRGGREGERLREKEGERERDTRVAGVGLHFFSSSQPVT